MDLKLGSVVCSDILFDACAAKTLGYTVVCSDISLDAVTAGTLGCKICSGIFLVAILAVKLA